MTKDKLIDRIETRLQFTITIVALFLALSINQNISLSGSILLVAYVIDYILFAILGDKMTERSLKITNVWILVGIAAYIIPLYLVSLSTQYNALPIWQGYLWIGSSFVSILFMITVPLVILVSILVSGIKWKK